MNELKRSVERATGGIRVSTDAFERVVERAHRRDVGRRVRAALLGVAVLGLLVAGLIELRPLGGSPAGESARYEGRVLKATATGGDAWLLTCTLDCSSDMPAGRGLIQQFLGRDGSVARGYSLANDSPQTIVVQGGSLYSLSFKPAYVRRYDAQTGRLIWQTGLDASTGTIPGADFLAYDLAVSDGAVWVSSGRGLLAEVDQGTGAVTQVVDLPPESTGSITWGDSSVWVAEGLDGLYRVDPGVGVSAKIAVANRAGDVLSVSQVATTSRGVWVVGDWAAPRIDAQGSHDFVLTGQQSLALIDPATNSVTKTIALPNPIEMTVVGDSPWFVSSDGRTLYALGTDDQLFSVAVDIETGDRIVAVEHDGAWVAGEAGTLVKRMFSAN